MRKFWGFPWLIVLLACTICSSFIFGELLEYDKDEGLVWATLLTVTLTAIVFVAFLAIVRWREKRQLKKELFEEQKAKIIAMINEALSKKEE